MDYLTLPCICECDRTWIVAKISNLVCVHTLYNNTNIKKDCLQNSQSYIFTYPLKQHKHRHKGLLPKLPVLHVNIPSTTTQI